MDDGLTLNFAPPTDASSNERFSGVDVKGSWKKKRIVTKIAKHKATKFGSSNTSGTMGYGQKPVDNRKIDVLSASSLPSPVAPKGSASNRGGSGGSVKVVSQVNKSSSFKPNSQQQQKPKGSFTTSLFTGNPTIDASTTQSSTLPAVTDVKQSSNAVPVTTTDTTTFKGLGLDPLLVSHLSLKMNVQVPTRIQQSTLAALVAQGVHRDCMVQAQTGSGKTLAYLLPIIHSLIRAESQISDVDRPSLNRNLGTLAIVLAPTRELAKQINTVLEQLLMYSRGSGPKPSTEAKAGNVEDGDDSDNDDEEVEKEEAVVKLSAAPKVSKHWIVPGLVVGGDKKKSEKARLRKGCTILVSTPGRLLDHLKTTQSFELGNLRWLVLDEADRFLELGFEETLRELLSIIDEKRKIAVNTHKRLTSPPCWPIHKQILLTSATIKGNVQRLAETSLKNPLFIQAAEEDGEKDAAKQQKKEDDFDVAKKATKGKDFIVKKKDSGDDESDDDFWTEQEKIQAQEDVDEDDESGEEDAMDITPAVDNSNGDDDEEMFTVPEQLKQTYVIVPAKLRLVTLVAVLRQVSSQATKNHPFKAILFTDTCDSVDFLHHILSNGHKGPSRDEAEAEANAKPKPKDTSQEKSHQSKDKQNPSSKPNDDTKDKSSTNKPEKPSIAPAQSDTLPSTGLSSPLFPHTHIYKLHGNLSQKVRDTAFTGFKQHPFSVLICTDVAARGLDLPDISFVIQYDMPSDVKDYVHRIGRTARLGREGSAVSLLLPSEVKYVELLARRGVKVMAEDGMGLLKHLIGAPLAAEPHGGSSDKKKESSRKDKKKSLEDWATDIQMMFERFVMADEKNLELARSAFRSHVRAYTTHVASEKHMFNIKALHLGHVAKSFALRDAPGMSMGAAAPSESYTNSKNHKKVGDKKKAPPTLKKRAYQLQSTSASASEFGDGGVQKLVGGTRKKVRVLY
ncbi:P-loop containing nucleoside triphosphate hydrolase protein [Obelidium mucronatum]|nr:P-loop containing nucleoside triphosphate hydrolase protein [Obelidium mucronatum]